MDRASVDLIRAPFSLTPEQEDELPPLPCDRHGRLVGATLEHVGVYIDAFTLCGLDDMDKVARFAFANRNGQRAQKHQKPLLQQQVRPMLRKAVRHAANARTALLLGEIDVYEKERGDAIETLRNSKEWFLKIVALQAVKHSQGQSVKARKPRGVLDNGETVAGVVERLAVAPELRTLTAKELWTHLHAELERLGLDPIAIEEGEDIRTWLYEYDFKGRRKPLKFSTFQDYVTAARNEKSD